MLPARVFEAIIPLLIKKSVDNIVLGIEPSGRTVIDYDDAMDALVFPCLAIVGGVIAQMTVTIFSRIMIRRIGMEAAYDLRNRIYNNPQKQGIYYTLNQLQFHDVNTEVTEYS